MPDDRNYFRLPSCSSAIARLLLGEDGQLEVLITQCSMAPIGQSLPGATGRSYGMQWSTQLVVQPINSDAAVRGSGTR